MATINKLADDCLELIFIHSDGNPWTLSTISEVCRRWYHIAQRPSVVSSQKYDIHARPNPHIRLVAYTQSLSSVQAHCLRQIPLCWTHQTAPGVCKASAYIETKRDSAQPSKTNAFESTTSCHTLGDVQPLFSRDWPSISATQADIVWYWVHYMQQYRDLVRHKAVQYRLVLGAPSFTSSLLSFQRRWTFWVCVNSQCTRISGTCCERY